MKKQYPTIYLYDGHKLTLLNGSSIMRFLATGDDNVFIVNGKDEEIYLIEDKTVILKLQTITSNYSETEAMAMILPMLNPGRYG